MIFCLHIKGLNGSRPIARMPIARKANCPKSQLPESSIARKANCPKTQLPEISQLPERPIARKTFKCRKRHEIDQKTYVNLQYVISSSKLIQKICKTKIYSNK